jgi:hypothetical protein
MPPDGHETSNFKVWSSLQQQGVALAADYVGTTLDMRVFKVSGE